MGQRVLSQSRITFASLMFDLIVAFASICPFSFYRCWGMLKMKSYYFFAGRKLRKNARQSLDIAFGDALSREDKERYARMSFTHLMEGMVGTAYAMGNQGITYRFFDVEGLECLEKALERGKGAAIAIAHFGPFAWMLFKFVDLGYRVNTIMRPPRDKGLYDTLSRSKDRFGINLIYSVPIRSCVVESLKALERGELVFMPVDQNYGGQGRLFVDFFGRKAATASGPVAFALKTGAPLFFVYAVPDGQSRWRIIIRPEIELDRFGSEREILLKNTASLTKELEVLVQKHPEQWSWMHKRWKAVPKRGEV